MNQGILVTLNTDDMGIEGTTLANEYRYMELLKPLTDHYQKHFAVGRERRQSPGRNDRKEHYR